MLIKIRSLLVARLRSFAKDKGGAAAVIMALLIPILIAGLAFGSELGMWELSRRKLQNAADTAAHAAAMQIRSGVTSNGDLKAVAKSVAAVSGYTEGDAGITIQRPPADGAFSGDANAIRIMLAHSIPRQFSAIYNQAPVQFTVQSTAHLEGGRPACVLALHPSASGAISVGGSTDVTLAGCDIAANSTSTSAVKTTGNGASVEVECVSAVGGVDDGHSIIDYTECSGPTVNAPPILDPYASVPEPACSSYQNASAFNASSPGSGVAGAVNCYQNVNSISTNINLKSNGVYVLHNSNFTLNGNRSISGTNVTIFLSGNSSIKVSGNGTLNLRAPTSGVYSGIAVFGDRDTATDLDLTGNSGVSIVGAVYAPNSGSDITYTGNTSGFTAGQCTQVIGGTVTFWGSAEFNTDCSNSGTRQIQTAQSVRIVE